MYFIYNNSKQMDNITYLRECFNDIGTHITKYFKSSFKQACIENNEHVMTIIYSFGRTLNIDMNVNELFTDMCINNKINNAKSIYKIAHGSQIINSINNVDNLFAECCKRCNIEVAKWLFVLSNNKISSEKIYDALTIACQNGNFKMAKWLYTTYEFNNSDLIRLFNISCTHYQIKIVKWLYILIDKPVDLTKIVESCVHGYFNIVKWLYEKEKYNLDNHKYANTLFMIFCGYNKYELVEWLYNITNSGVNIRCYNDESFLLCCRHGYINLAQWLCDRCPEYSITIQNGKIIDYNITPLNIKIAEKTSDKIIEILKLQISIGELNEECFFCLEDSDIKFKCNHVMCFSCMIKLYIKSGKQMQCEFCHRPFKFHETNFFIKSNE